MNKKEELLDKINGLNLVNPDKYGTEYNRGVYNSSAVINRFFKMELIPEVPQFVADWYEDNKDDFEYLIWEWFNYKSKEGLKKNRQFYLWLNDCTNKPVETLVKMKLFGYEVKKEKRYYVRLKGVVDNLRLLRHNLPTNTWTIGSEEQCFNVSGAHTRKELEEAGFGEVFNSPLFEVEEVMV